MNYIDVKNPVWANAQQTLINCEVNFNHLPEEFVPFTADPNDTGNQSSKQIFDDCKAGVYGPVGEYVPHVPTAEYNKHTASELLSATDWTAVPDVSDPTKSTPHLTNVNDFLSYRNELRQYVVNPVSGNVAWPTKPNAIWSD